MAWTMFKQAPGMIQKGFNQTVRDTTGAQGFHTKEDTGFLSKQWVSDKWDRFTGKKQEDLIKEQNRKQENFQREMYEMQRRDALADWSRNNAYNSPEQQLNRLRQAGLNPNLAYGDLASGAAGMVRTANPDSLNQQMVTAADPLSKMTQLGGGLFNTILDFTNLGIRKAQKENIQQDTANKKAQEAGFLLENLNKEIKNESNRVNLGILKEAKEDILKALQYKALNLEGDSQLKAQSLQWNQVFNQLKEHMTKSQIELIELSAQSKDYQNAILEYDAELVENLGLSRGSAAWATLLLKLAGTGIHGMKVRDGIKRNKARSWDPIRR